MAKINQFLFKNVPIYPLVTFRMVLGFLMFVSTLRFIYLGWIEDHYINSKFQFKFYGFEWVQLLPPFWMYALHGLMLLASLFVLLGFLYRWSSILLFLTFTYLELIDLTYYLNHYYFISLACLLMIFLPANRNLSLDAWWQPSIKTNQARAWHINILKFQIFVVYFYAGIAKINSDWLVNALPLKIWLPANDKVPLLGWLFVQDWVPYVFSWGGMFYDTFIIFLLLNARTRPIAYIFVLVFHAIVGILFQIGVFPVVMMGITLIFFSDKWHLQWQRALQSFLRKGAEFLRLNWFKKKAINGDLNKGKLTEDTGLEEASMISKPAFWGFHYIILTIYVLFQLLFPIRYVLYPGNLFWTEEGYRFSWRVMLMEKAGTATFYIKDAKTGRVGIVNNSEFLNLHQEKQMAFQPDMILQFAHFLGNYYESQGMHNPEVRVEAFVTLNARQGRLLIDPERDLMKIEESWVHKDWIIPFKD